MASPPWLQKAQGGLDKFMGRMAGPPSPFLSPQEQQAMLQRQRMSMAAALLQGARPVPRGTSSPGYAFGSAIQAGQESGDQFTADAMRARMLAAQMQGGGEGPASIQGYNLAVSQGYKGTYTDYKKEFEGREANIPSNVATWNVYNNLPTKEAKAEFLAVLRAGQIANIGGVPTMNPPGVAAGVAEPMPLSSPAIEAAGASRQAQATAEGTAAGEMAGGSKPVRLQAAARRLERVKKASEDLGFSMPGMGTVRGLMPAGQELEQANSQLITELTALTRIPGVGSQSDLEQRLAQLQLPTPGMYPNVRANAISELEAFIEDLGAAMEGVPEGAVDSVPDVSKMTDEQLRQILGE